MTLVFRMIFSVTGAAPTKQIATGWQRLHLGGPGSVKSSGDSAAGPAYRLTIRGHRRAAGHSMPSFFTRYLSCLNVIPSNSAALVLL